MSYVLSERHFRRYEHYITLIVNSYPEVVSLAPQPPVASTETLALRIRICFKAFLNAQRDGREWPVQFSTSKFLEVMNDIVTSTTVEPDRVVCGPTDRVRNKVPLGVQVEPNVEQVVPLLHINPPLSNDLDLIKAVGLMHHHQILTAPSWFQGSTVDIKELLNPLTVAVEKNGDLYIIL